MTPRSGGVPPEERLADDVQHPLTSWDAPGGHAKSDDKLLRRELKDCSKRRTNVAEIIQGEG